MSVVSFRLKNVSVTLVLLVLIFYFLYHAISGERGVLSFFQASSQYERLHSELEMVRAERVNLEHKVNLLKNSSLDMDLLDEQARNVLGLAKPTEKVEFKKEE